MSDLVAREGRASKALSRSASFRFAGATMMYSKWRFGRSKKVSDGGGRQEKLFAKCFSTLVEYFCAFPLPGWRFKGRKTCRNMFLCICEPLFPSPEARPEKDSTQPNPDWGDVLRCKFSSPLTSTPCIACRTHKLRGKWVFPSRA